eukprot:375436-Hanusia_phi.AAC.4
MRGGKEGRREGESEEKRGGEKEKRRRRECHPCYSRPAATVAPWRESMTCSLACRPPASGAPSPHTRSG